MLTAQTIARKAAIRAGLRKPEAQERRASTISLTDFKFAMYKRYQHPKHLEVFDYWLTQIALHVETQGREGIAFLLSEMPPRHGKTLTLSRYFPAWFLGRNPDYRVMNVSYGATLAEKSSRMARNLIASPLYQQHYPGVRLDPTSRAADAWNIDGHEGGMDAMGVLGGATGKGAHILNCDDLIKNREEAESQIIRDKVWDALTDDLLTRLEPGGAVVLNATRWHQDDPLGRALKELKRVYGDKMVHLRFPAIAEADDPLGRKEGEALWSERYPIDTLRRIETTMGQYSWSALYQQAPTPAEGGIFKRAWFTPLLDNVPEIVRTVRHWDMAMSEKTTADYTVGAKIGQATDGHFYILDVARKRIDWGDLTAWLADVMIADGPDVIQGLEEKGYMSRAITDLNMDYRLHDYKIFGYPVDKDKVTRALPYAAKCGAGLVHVVNAHWSQEYVDELCSFPNGTHDDQVDASSGAWAMIGNADYTSEMNFEPEAQYSTSDY